MAKGSVRLVGADIAPASASLLVNMVAAKGRWCCDESQSEESVHDVGYVPRPLAVLFTLYSPASELD